MERRGPGLATVFDRVGPAAAVHGGVEWRESKYIWPQSSVMKIFVILVERARVLLEGNIPVYKCLLFS